LEQRSFDDPAIRLGAVENKRGRLVVGVPGGVMALVLAFCVEDPVAVEVAARGERAELEDY